MGQVLWGGNDTEGLSWEERKDEYGLGCKRLQVRAEARKPSETQAWVTDCTTRNDMFLQIVREVHNHYVFKSLALAGHSGM